MKKFLSVLVLAMLLVTNAYAMFPVSTAGQAQMSKFNATSPFEGIGTAINQNKNLIKCVYDFAVSGGAAGAILLPDEQGNPCVVPVGGRVVRNYILPVTTPVGSGYMTYSIIAGGDLKAALAATSFTAGTGIEGVLTGSSTLMLGATTSASSQVYVTLSGTLTAGKVNMYVEYVY